jgi:hypothetical protein
MTERKMAAAYDFKRENSPMDEKEIGDILTLHNTLDKFLRATGSYVLDRKTDSREMTHTGLAGNIYSVKERDEPAFKALMCRDLNRASPFSYYICEFLRSRFPYFADFDIVRQYEMTEDEIDKLCTVLQESMDKLYGEDADIRCAVFWTAPERQMTDQGQVVYRYGIHFVWFAIVVDKYLAVRLYSLLLADLNRRIPPLLPPNSTWTVSFDADVYGDLTTPTGGGTGKKGSLRMPGNEKMKMCKHCKNGKKTVRSAEHDITVPPPAGDGNTTLDDVPADVAFASSGIPTDVADPTLHTSIHLLPSVGGGKVDKVALKVAHPIKPVDAPLNAANLVGMSGTISSRGAGRAIREGDCVVCNNTGKISLGRPYRAYRILDRRGKVMAEETKVFADPNKWEVAIQYGSLRIPQHLKLTDTLRVPLNAPLVPFSSGEQKIRYDKNGDPVAEKKRALPEKIRHLGGYMTSDDNAVGFKEQTTRFKFVVKNDSVKVLAEAAIREYNVNYKDIVLTDLRADKASRPCSWLCTVEGYGSHYCLNKGFNHSSASVYFRITPKGTLFQRCHCRKDIVRPGGNKTCKEYKSSERPLPALIRRALTWTKKDSPGFDSFEAEAIYTRFISKSMTPLGKDWVPPPPPSELQEDLLVRRASLDKDEADEAKLIMEDAMMINKLIVTRKLARSGGLADLLTSGMNRSTSLIAASSDTTFSEQEERSEAEQRREAASNTHLAALIKLKFKLKSAIGEFDEDELNAVGDDIRDLQLEDITQTSEINGDDDDDDDDAPTSSSRSRATHAAKVGNRRKIHSAEGAEGSDDETDTKGAPNFDLSALKEALDEEDKLESKSVKTSATKAKSTATKAKSTKTDKTIRKPPSSKALLGKIAGVSKPQTIYL